MAVKVLMVRSPRDQGDFMEVNRLLHDLRILAMSQPGYISGETLVASDAKGTTLVISNWASSRHWRDYEASPQREALTKQLESCLDGPTRTEVWVESPVIG